MRIVNHSGWETGPIRQVGRLVEAHLRGRAVVKGKAAGIMLTGRVIHVVPERSPLLRKLPPRNTHRIAGALTVTVPRGFDDGLAPKLDAVTLARSLAYVLAEVTLTLGPQSELRHKLDALVMLPRLPKIQDVGTVQKKREQELGNAITRKEFWERRVRLAERRLAKWQREEKRAAKKVIQAYVETRANGGSVPQPKLDHAEWIAAGRVGRPSAAWVVLQDQEQAAARVVLKRRSASAVSKLIAQDLAMAYETTIFDKLLKDPMDVDDLRPGKVVEFVRYEQLPGWPPPGRMEHE